jgi:dephospho-CoA kinase
MIITGITGGIGSGKTTVCAVFEVLGVPVYYADDESKRLLDVPHISEAIIKIFGEGVISEGKIDRKKMAALVFNDAEKLHQLNEIMHPAVKKHFAGWCEQHKNVPYVLKEAAILFESGTYKNVQKVITVTAPVEMRINRVMQRDKLAKEEVEKRIASQWSDEEKIKHSDFVIQNNEEQLIIPGIIQIHKELGGV